MATHTRDIELDTPAGASFHLKPLERTILERRATAHFIENATLPEDELNLILSAAAQAPSGYNLQPWRFIVVRDKQQREKLRAAAFDQAKITEAPVVVIALGPHDGWKEAADDVFQDSVQRGAMPAEIAAKSKTGAVSFIESLDRAVWLNRHVMIAFTYMMLVAESLGWDTAPMEGFDPYAVREAFGIPADCEVIALLAMGRAKEPDRPYPGRFPIERLVYSEQYGQPWQAQQT